MMKNTEKTMEKIVALCKKNNVKVISATENISNNLKNNKEERKKDPNIIDHDEITDDHIIKK